jgi:hypothetical protein
MKKLIFFSLSILLLSCYPNYNYDRNGITKGYKPIYISYETFRKIETLKPQKLIQPGKIYIKDKYLYINEIGQGIHVFDNSDKTKPINLSFISIPANKDISIIDNILYADNGDDLVAIDIANPLAAKLMKRVEKAFPYPSFPQQRGSFECADPAKGYVIDWEFTELDSPKCYR